MLKKNNKDKKNKKQTIKKNIKKSSEKRHEGTRDILSFDPDPKPINVRLFLNITYGLMIITPTILIGLILAFILLNIVKEKWVLSHLRYIIQTVAYSLITMIIGFLFMYHITSAFFYIIGFAIIILTSIWYYLRLIGGWLIFNQDRPIGGHFGGKFR